MRKRYVALLLGAVVAATFTVPAFGGSSLLHRLTHRVKVVKHRQHRLTRRVNALALLGYDFARSDLRTHIRSATQLAGSSGVAAAVARCAGGEQATGGGAEFDPPHADDNIAISSPYAPGGEPIGWRAGGVGSPNAILTVYVVCATYGQ